MYFNRKRKQRLIVCISCLVILMACFFGTMYFWNSSDSVVVSNQIQENDTTIYQGLTYLQDEGEAKIIINAPDEVKLGKLVILDVSQSTGNKFKWMVVPETEDFLVIDDGRRAVFSSGVPGEYLFLVACATGDSVDIQRHIVRVLGVTPTPDPDIPVPDPDTPNNISSELSKKVIAWGASIQSPTKKDDALELAKGFESVAAQIDAGVLTSAYNIIQATTEANKAALGERIQAWIPFLRNLQNELETQADNSNLITPAQHAVAWKEIAKGLRYLSTH